MVRRKRKNENSFQPDLIAELKKIFEGCLILKNDARYMQGIPDLIILYKNKWALLECKKGANEKHQPNQDYYVEKANRMSFASFIFPENKEEVIEKLKGYFQ